MLMGIKGEPYLPDILIKRDAMQAGHVRDRYRDLDVDMIWVHCSDDRVRPNEYFSLLPQATRTPFMRPFAGHRSGVTLELKNAGAKIYPWQYPARDRIINHLGKHTSREPVHIMGVGFHDSSIGADKLLCAGQGYSRQKAHASCLRSRDQFTRAFGSRMFVFGHCYDTATGNVTFYGDNPEKNMSALDIPIDADGQFIYGFMRDLYPRASDLVLMEMVNLAFGCMAHVESFRRDGVILIDNRHIAPGLLIGRRVGWVEERPEGGRLRTLILEDVAPKLKEEIQTLIGLLQANLAEGTIVRDKGVFSFACVPYWPDEPCGKESSVEAALDISDMVREIVGHFYPLLEPSFRRYAAVINEVTRQLDMVGCNALSVRDGDHAAAELHTTIARLQPSRRDVLSSPVARTGEFSETGSAVRTSSDIGVAAV